jgi:two-component system LytT family response regulator
VAQALEHVQAEGPDLVFLDIELSGAKNGGFDFLRQVDSPEFDIVFTTMRRDSAIRAIRLCALDYLVKPILQEELEQAVLRCRDQRKARLEQVKTLKANLALEKGKGECIWINNGSEVIRLDTDNILYAESDNSTTFFFLRKEEHGTRKHTSTKPIHKWEELLEGNRFLRIHNSYLVNLAEVISVKRDLVRLSDGTELPVSRQKREILVEELGLK